MTPSDDQIQRNLANLSPRMQAVVRKVLALRKDVRIENGHPHSGEAPSSLARSNTNSGASPSYLCRYLELASPEAIRDMFKSYRWNKWPAEAQETLRRRWLVLRDELTSR